MDKDEQGEFCLQSLQWKGYVKFLCKEEYYKAVLSGQPKDTDRAWLVALKDPTLTGKLKKPNKLDSFFFLLGVQCALLFRPLWARPTAAEGTLVEPPALCITPGRVKGGHSLPAFFVKSQQVGTSVCQLGALHAVPCSALQSDKLNRLEAKSSPPWGLAV